MTNITKLIPDIYELIQSKREWFTPEIASQLSKSITDRLSSSYNFQHEEKPTLRLSKLGPTCPHALWQSIHHPELAQPLRAPTKLMFGYGHIIEAQTIALARAAGHEVTGEQDELFVDDIKGHRDCVIDGCIVDVKSSSTRNMEKFKSGSIAEDDLFGYLDQLDGYLVASLDDPSVRTKDRGYLLAIDKQLGNMVLYEHKFTESRERALRERIAEYKRIIDGVNPPACECGVVAEGESGNLGLDVRASYSNYKFVCFPKLRTAIYSKGPIYFTRVVKWPSHKGVPLLEVDQHGQPVRNNTLY